RRDGDQPQDVVRLSPEWSVLALPRARGHADAARSAAAPHPCAGIDREPGRAKPPCVDQLQGLGPGGELQYGRRAERLRELGTAALLHGSPQPPLLTLTGDAIDDQTRPSY